MIGWHLLSLTPIAVADEVIGKDWPVVRRCLPAGWAQQSRKTGAWRRGGRKIEAPGAVHRIPRIHLASGRSLKETASSALQAGLGQVSAVATFQRLRAAGEWLRRLAAKERAMLGRKTPKWQRRLRSLDAMTAGEPGRFRANWRLHYAIDGAPRAQRAEEGPMCVTA